MQYSVQRFFEANRDYHEFQIGTDDEQYISLICSTSANQPQGKQKVVLVICKPGFDQIGKKTIIHLVAEYPPSQFDHFILVCAKVSRQGLALLDSFSRAETLSFDDILIHRLDHKYVPKYRVLNAAEVAEVTTKYGNPRHFPKLRASVDIIARLLDFRPGQVLRATIKCPFRGETIAYRYIIA